MKKKITSLDLKKRAVKTEKLGTVPNFGLSSCVCRIAGNFHSSKSS